MTVTIIRPRVTLCAWRDVKSRGTKPSVKGVGDCHRHLLVRWVYRDVQRGHRRPEGGGGGGVEVFGKFDFV